MSGATDNSQYFLMTVKRRKKKGRGIHGLTDPIMVIFSFSRGFYDRSQMFYVDRDRLFKQDVNSFLDCLDCLDSGGYMVRVDS